MELNQGYILVYTGNGKGKTTAAAGLALRATSYGLKTAFIQFMKDGNEQRLFTPVPHLTYRAFGRNHETNGWYHPLSHGESTPPEVAEGWHYAKEIIEGGFYDLVILDEINVALLFNFISPIQLINLLQSKPQHVEIVCTGRGAPKELLDLADLVTEFREEKHMYQKGIPARKGIDF